jgi:hypothetical protein
MFVNVVGLRRLYLSVVVAANLAGRTRQGHQQGRVDIRSSSCILLECGKGLAFCLLAELLRWLERGEFFDCGALFYRATLIRLFYVLRLALLRCLE